MRMRWGVREPSEGRALWRGVTFVCAVAVLTLAACGPTAPSPTTLLARAQQKFNQTKSLHFVLTATNLGANDPLPVTTAQGDLQRPDQLSAKATVVAGGLTIQEQLIIIGSQQWITNPLTGTWESTDRFGGFLTIFDPQKGVGGVLTSMRNPSTPSDAKSGNTACWKISGQVASDALGAVIGTDDVVAGASVPTTVCIGKSDNEVYTVTLTGRVSVTDTPQTTRTFVLSNFDQPVSIQPPPA